MTRGDYKLVQYRVDGATREQLFDLKADPWETQPLAAPETRQALRVELDAWMTTHGDPCATNFGTRLDSTTP